MISHPLNHPIKLSTLSLTALALLSLTAAASAQTVYSENFNTGYNAGNTLSDQNGWTTNDEGTGGQYTYNTTQTGDIGQSDDLDYQSNFGFSKTDYSAFLGGGFGQAVAPGVVATTSAVTLAQTLPTSAATMVNFSTDYQVTNPTTAFPSHDTFGFALTGASGASLITLNFVPNSTNATNRDNITYTAGTAVGASTGFGMNLGANTRYKLNISVNITAGTFSASYQSEDATTGALTSTATALASGTYAGGAITGYEALWSLFDKTAVTAANNPTAAGTNNMAHTDAGLNALYFDNIVVSVPEPSTYALMGLGMLGLVAVVRNRRAQRA